jgi:hypothetical protein
VPSSYPGPDKIHEVHPGPTVLGINAAHNAAACLMVRGRIVAAVAGSGSTFIAKRLPKPERSN